MLSVSETLDQILAAVRRLPAEPNPLAQAVGRVLAEDVYLDVDSPPFDNSSMDGYAVRAHDTAGASPDRPVVLLEVGQAPAGAGAPCEVRPGTCVRIMTGAPIPPGADAIVVVEDTERHAGLGDRIEVSVRRAAGLGDFVRRAGEDVPAGTRVVRAGALIGPAEVAMLAAAGRPAPVCVRRPRVALLTTGDELVGISERPGPGRIRDVNLHAMEALAVATGAEATMRERVPDDADATAGVLRQAADAADVVVVSGGVSVGDRDFVRPAVERIGALDLWRVRMKPGKPLAFGRVGDALLFGLPGNPVSTMVTWEVFVRPALWRMAGRDDVARPSVPAVLDADLPHKPGRQEYVRACLWRDGAVFRARPTGHQGSGMLASMLGANALLVVPEDSGDVGVGSVLRAELLADGLPHAAPGPSPHASLDAPADVTRGTGAR